MTATEIIALVRRIKIRLVVNNHGIQTKQTAPTKPRLKVAL